MRHSTIRLTLDTYGHLVKGAEQRAVLDVQFADQIRTKPAAIVCETAQLSATDAQEEDDDDPSKKPRKNSANANSCEAMLPVAARGVGGSRTRDGGFAIRCLSHLATTP